MNNTNFVSVDDVLINMEVITTPFACDVQKCKGACCTFESSYGAPLKKEEIKIIATIYDNVKEFMMPIYIKEVEQYGFYELKEDEYFTRSFNDKDCVFVYYEKSIAKCAIEKAFVEGKINFKKPISCHLFPIRVNSFGGDVLKFEKFKECEPALENGAKSNISVAKFCNEALIRYRNKKWYSALINLGL